MSRRKPCLKNRMDPTVEEGVGVMALEHPVPQRPIFNGNSAVQSGERNTRHKAGDLQLHDARGPACRSTPATATVVRGLICGRSDEY
jgi:hypothetical protein